MKMRDGRLWWRGENGLYLQDGDEWQKFTLPEGGSFASISAFMQARNNSIWFAGTYNSRPVIANFSGETWRIWDSKTTGLGKITVGYKFAEDDDGGIWIAQGHEKVSEHAVAMIASKEEKASCTSMVKPGTTIL